MTNKIFKYWLPFLSWCFIIYYLSAIPYLKTEMGIWDLIFRKIAHIIEYGILFFLTFKAIKSSFNLKMKTVYFIAFIFSFFYACSDEFHQGFVPGRGPSLGDVGFDTLGILIAVTLFRFFEIKKSDSMELK